MEAQVKKKWRLFRKEHKKVPEPEPEPIPEPEPEPIKEEEVVKEVIEKTDLMREFEAETGKKAIWGGKITKGFLKWKEECEC
jgi:hypothetical protein